MKKNDKSYFEKLRKCTEAVSNGNMLYEEWGDNILLDENTYSSDNLRKAYYVVSKILDNIEDDVVLSNDDIKVLLDEKRDEIFKQRVRLQDERRMKNKDLRVQARYENLIDVLKDNIQSIPEKEYTKLYDKNKIQNVEASLLISDLHYGIKVDNALNYYDTETAKQDLEVIFSKVSDACLKNNVKILHIELLGDLISGVINLQSKVDAEEDVLTQTENCSKMLAQFIKRLEPYVPTIEIYGVVGNHSRLNENKKINMPAENFERLLFSFLHLRLPNIPLHLNGIEDWLTYKVKDKEIFISHGDKDSMVNAKKNSVDLLGRVVDEIHLGHIHHFNIKDDNNTEIIVNGSLVSTDDYSMSIRKNTKPCQVLRIYGNDTITYKLEIER